MTNHNTSIKAIIKTNKFISITFYTVHLITLLKRKITTLSLGWNELMCTYFYILCLQNTMAMYIFIYICVCCIWVYIRSDSTTILHWNPALCRLNIEKWIALPLPEWVKHIYNTTDGYGNVSHRIFRTRFLPFTVMPYHAHERNNAFGLHHQRWWMMVYGGNRIRYSVCMCDPLFAVRSYHYNESEFEYKGRTFLSLFLTALLYVNGTYGFGIK